MRTFKNLRVVFALLAAAALVLPATGALAKKKTSRFGLEGRVVEFDDSRNVLVVKVVKTKVSGGVAGRPAPKKSFKRGATVEFAVVPEGSVLKRTVIKNKDGAGLDTTGTKEGFLKALAMVPGDSNAVFSFEKVKEPQDGKPEWDLRIIQLRMTEAEIEERWKDADAKE